MTTPTEPCYATAVPIYNPDYVAATATTATIPEQPKSDVPSRGGRGNYPLPSFSSNQNISQSQVDQLVKKQGFTRGLAQAMTKNNQVFPQRVWIVDNSGSMMKPDGHRIVDNGRSNKTIKTVPCTRWEEIRECVSTHIELSSLLKVSTQFRLLNDPGTQVGPQAFYSGRTNGDHFQAMNMMTQVQPRGGTPLRKHIEEIHAHVRSIMPTLNGGKVVICIATDGLPTNEMAIGGKVEQERFVDSLRLLEGLPVWVVIRLCTDDDEVVHFYNDLDEQLELSLEVLDDFQAEALEVYEHNPWLNYSLPLHRCREMGFYHRVFDLIDERALTKAEVREFLQLIFGEDHFDGVVDPAVDWMGFSSHMEGLVRKEEKQWDPIKKQVMPLIHMNVLNRKYGGGAGGCACNIL